VTIAVVVPTNRPEQYQQFVRYWDPLFRLHDVDLFTVFDGDDPICKHGKKEVLLSERIQWADLIYTHTDAVRNFGFLLALETLGKDIEMILTLDDDVYPIRGNDPIDDHLRALDQRVPISWFSTADRYMRGFPYGVREEAEVWVSHGVWEGVHDYDGPTQLVLGNPPAKFYKGPIPKGALFPCCGMNLAWKLDATPWMYFAPMSKELGVQRFADIWMGIWMKQRLDVWNKAVVSGYSTVWHSRASNVLNNLEQEARGIKFNEELWRLDTQQTSEEFQPYYLLWSKCLAKWTDTVNDLLSPSKKVETPEVKKGEVNE